MADTADCDYRLLDNGIHEFTFNRPTRQAVDMHFEKLHEIYAALPKGAVVRCLVGVPHGFPPMNYTFGKVREFNRHHTDNPGHYAFLYGRSNVMLSLVQTFFKTVAGGTMGTMFPDTERDQAIAWLLEK